MIAALLEPAHMKAREELGYAYWMTRQFSKAVEVYRKMLRIDPTYKRHLIQQNLVCSLDDNGEHEEARKV